MQGYLRCRVLCAKIPTRTLWMTNLDCVLQFNKKTLVFIDPKMGSNSYYIPPVKKFTQFLDKKNRIGDHTCCLPATPQPSRLAIPVWKPSWEPPQRAKQLFQSTHKLSRGSHPPTYALFIELISHLPHKQVFSPIYCSGLFQKFQISSCIGLKIRLEISPTYFLLQN